MLTMVQILHILTASPSHAQLLLRCAHEAGFRESGAINITTPSQQPLAAVTPLVAVRSMGLGFESLIGQEVAVRDDEEERRRMPLVSPEYLRMLMSVATERFAENAKRINRFRTAFRQAFDERQPTAATQMRRNRDRKEWEDAGARRQRKRAEGLKRMGELKESRQSTPPAVHDDSGPVDDKTLL